MRQQPSRLVQVESIDGFFLIDTHKVHLSEEDLAGGFVDVELDADDDIDRHRPDLGVVAVHVDIDDVFAVRNTPGIGHLVIAAVRSLR